MERKRLFDVPGTALVFWVYATLAWAGGFTLCAWGPMWLGTDLPGLPFGKAALVRLAGAAIMAAGCFAAAMAQVADEDERRHGMLWFGIAHSILWMTAFIQQQAIWNSPLADQALFLLLILTFGFLFFCQLDRSAVRARLEQEVGLQTLFGVSRLVRQSGASRREREIREAASREERNRLARDLHDSIKQQLFAIQTAAATAQTRFEPDPDGARGAIAQVRTSAREAMTEMEVLLDQLRAAPLENVGLVEALKRQCEAVGFRTGAKVEFTLGELPPNSTLPPGAQQALFRVAQEALANVARHARATHLEVALASVEGRLKLTVEDDGTGFDPGHADAGMGIRNMRERAAEFGGVFELASSPGGGTRLSAAIPFTSPTTQSEYLKNARNEGLTLLVMVVYAVARHSGAVAGFSLIYSYRFFSALWRWSNARAGREAIR